MTADMARSAVVCEAMVPNGLGLGLVMPRELLDLILGSDRSHCIQRLGKRCSMLLPVLLDLVQPFLEER